MLAVSRAGDTPAQILAQTTLKKTGAPVLVLLTAATPGGPLQGGGADPGAAGRRDRRPSTRRPTARPPSATAQGLAATPDEVVASVRRRRCASRSPATSKLLAADPLTEQLRQSAQRPVAGPQQPGHVHPDLHAQGRPRRAAPQGRQGRHRLRPPRCATTRSPCARPQKLTPDKELTLLTGIKQITSEAKLTSNEIIAIVIPRQRTVPRGRCVGPDRRRLGSVRQD